MLTMTLLVCSGDKIPLAATDSAWLKMLSITSVDSDSRVAITARSGKGLAASPAHQPGADDPNGQFVEATEQSIRLLRQREDRGPASAAYQRSEERPGMRVAVAD